VIDAFAIGETERWWNSSLGWLFRRWSNPVECYVHSADAACPACGSATGRISLLTAWTCYYACHACDHRWTRDAQAHR
jgi:hypothetical protein